jgi:hypothetical protein
MNRGTIWTVTLVIFCRLHSNVKFKAIFKTNIVNFSIIHVVTKFNETHHKTFG